ncbi:sensor domain-containing diguanylate cyclase [Kosakonia sp.]|uniref:sensor domain-containing diguanylate cyclase n=1 Tax=Kosakonia sp. TaxID=1916651 RepID=UPI0028AA7BDB|nr:sensor domain-containing diguanylate cyclase [Kosakonia sp.]
MKKEIFFAASFITVVFFAISITLIVQILSTKNHTRNELNTNISNLSHTLDTYSEGIIRQSEMLIKNISDITEIYGMDPAQLVNIKKILADQNLLLTQLNNIIIYDDKGNKVIALQENFWGRSNSADRFFFIHHRDNNSKDIFIGPPVVSRTNGQWVITVSRRLEDNEGNFKGVAVLTLNIANFLQTYGKLDIGKQGAIALTSDAGIVLLRYPFDDKYMGKEISDSPLFTDYLKRENSGIATSVSRFDKIERIYSFQKNKRYGLVTTVAVSIDEAMASWRRQSEILAAIILFLIGCVSFSSYYLIQDVRNRIRIGKELSAAKESLASENAELQVMATEDGLTGLANRRKFDEALVDEVAKCTSNKQQIALLLIDVDYFKKYNDNYGHIAGDGCLQAVAENLKKTISETSFLAARYGGEEFVVILPETDANSAGNIARKIGHNIKLANIPHQQSPLGVVSVSIGVAAGSAAALKGREAMLIEFADEALYAAKSSGRDRVVTSNRQIA